MVVVMEQSATDADIEAVAESVRADGGRGVRLARDGAHDHRARRRHGAVPDDPVRQMPGVDHVIQVGKPYKMVSRDLHPETTAVKVGTVPIGRDSFTIIAGPCAVENEEQTMAAVKAAKDAGATIMRGDVYKPRTSPYSFQGLGELGIEILQEARRRFGLPIVVEVVDVSQVAHVADVADCIRIGTRNAQNFELLKEVGHTNKPVMLKRGLAMTIEEWLQAAEYVAQRGNSEIDLVRTRDPDVRTLDAQHARPGRHGGGAAGVAPARDGRSVARGREALARRADGVRGDRGRRRRRDDRHPPAIPRTRSWTAPRRWCPDEVIALGKQLQAIADALGRPVNR